jgi:Flp pilus assembly protein TadD
MMEAVSKKPAAKAPHVTTVSIEALKNKAVASHKAGDLNQAIEGYKLCLKIRPNDAGAWSNLGVALRKKKRYQSAINCYHRAQEINPHDIAVMGNLANALKDVNRLDEACALHAQVVKQTPDNIQNLMNYASALREAGSFAQALQQLDKARAVDPDNAGVEWERSQNLLYLGRYTEGWQAYEARWETGELTERAFPYPQWRGEPLQGKRILLHTEQGYGDTILAARFIPTLKQQGAHVSLQCKPELHRLFKSVGADVILDEATDSKVIAKSSMQSGTVRASHPEAPPEGLVFDYHCSLMSLMAGLNTSVDNIPAPASLSVPESSCHTFKNLQFQNNGCLKVGIIWSGSITFANNDNRAVGIEKFLPLAEIPKVRLYSLQKGPREKELSISGADCVIENLAPRFDDFADTAAAIAHLDVVVKTDSSVAHLAASLGKPVINLLQKVPYWLYTLEQQTTPWYPSMTLIKQEQPGVWDDVFSKAEKMLREMALIKSAPNNPDPH